MTQFSIFVFMRYFFSICWAGT